MSIVTYQVVQVAVSGLGWGGRGITWPHSSVHVVYHTMSSQALVQFPPRKVILSLGSVCASLFQFLSIF